mmetsp:Transcript_123273/g.348339  ORF Transcript_123273/g.348339 Transcript_123273/m.348339 type:complete len:161 (-) Transcript_123273:83-565(-)
MPETHLEKEYLVVTSCKQDGKPPPASVFEQLRHGVVLTDGPAHADVAELVSFDGSFARLRLVVTSGRFHMVRRMLRAVGYSCLQLVRTRVGTIGGIAIRHERLGDAAAECADEPCPAPAPAVLGAREAKLWPGEFATVEPSEVQAMYRRGLRWLHQHHPV